MRLGASVRNRPGCGKSITSGGLPPWINTGAWTSNWSVPWKSIVTPVHSTSGSQKSVKIWMASGSFSLLRTGERMRDRLALVLLVARDLAPEQPLGRRRVVPSVRGAVGCRRCPRAPPCPRTPRCLRAPRCRGRRGAAGRLGVGAARPVVVVVAAGDEHQRCDRRECRDALAVSHAQTPPYRHAPGRISRPVELTPTPDTSSLAMRLEMMWNRMEDSERYHSSRCDRGEDAVGQNRRRQQTSSRRGLQWAASRSRRSTRCTRTGSTPCTTSRSRWPTASSWCSSARRAVGSRPRCA